MTTHNELLAEATQNYALAHHYLNKLKVSLDQLSASQSGIAQASRPPVRCVREWQDWLSDNGPAIKGDIQEATGIKFTERGTPYTVEWTSSLAQEPDDRFAPNTLMKINLKPDGRGAPPKVYFLWSQRWDVQPKFGVGPIKPDDWEESTHPVEPVDNFGDWSMDELVECQSDGASDEPSRFATVEEWNDANAAWFDAMVSAESRPTVEQKQALLDTLPHGVVDGNGLIASAYADAVKRSREPVSSALLGVVHPPEENT